MAQKPARTGPRGGRENGGKLATLLKILDLETQQGFSDRAVAGGLDRFLEASADDLGDVPGRAPVGPGGYAALSSAARREWVLRARALAGGSAEASPPPVSPPSAKRPPPRATRTQRAPLKGSRGGTAAPSPTLDTPVGSLRFIRRPTAAKLRKMGVETLLDLLYMFPFRHVDYSDVTSIGELEFGQTASVIGHVVQSSRKRIGRGAAHAVVSDGTGIIEATWFNQPYLVDRFRPGTTLALSGKVQVYRERAQFQNPEYEIITAGADDLLHAGIMLPVYPATEGLQQRTLRNAAGKAIEAGLHLLHDPLADELRNRHGFRELGRAVRDMHLPGSPEDRAEARRRLAFDELFLNQLAVQRRRLEWQDRSAGAAIPNGHAATKGFIGSLPFRLTAGQDAALDAVLREMGRTTPMGRLLQGEVGSGKTVVAVAAMLAAVQAGYQAALMAPTEVLTEQHFLNISAMLGADPGDAFNQGTVRTVNVSGLPRPVRLAILVGSLRESKKTEVRRQIADGVVDIAIGTHALLQEAVEFPKLALAVVDEQHRFGVEQRAGLNEKGVRPHLLALSATPIPRSLALTLYGDLDLTTLRELPAGRREIETRWLRRARDRKAGYRLIREEVASGRQAFVVCPLIDPSDEIEARAATVEFERLSGGEFSDLRVGLLHGRMALAEKQAVMSEFRAGRLDVLVATPVIEVGIDVPNATVMMIESAERFGLSQLHQLRGRVGRGEFESHCLLLSDGAGTEARERLSIIERLSDGFELAEEDLRIRGPGDYLGTRQSGFAEFSVAALTDVELMTLARSEAMDLLAADPLLEAPGHRALAAPVTQALERMVGTPS